MRRSEKSLNAAQRIAHLGNWELDLVTHVLTWSDEIYRIFEIAPHAFVMPIEYAVGLALAAFMRFGSEKNTGFSLNLMNMKASRGFK